MPDEKTPSEEPTAGAPPRGNPPAPGEGSPKLAAPELSQPPEAEPAPPVTDWESRFKYLLADFENFRKRAERERESVRFRAEADVLRNFLPIQDSFERAREFVRKAPHADPVRKGMELLAREWDGFLKREGIEPVAHVGGRFNPDEHEVMGEAPPPTGQSPGTVLEVVQQGYRFPGGLLRPAKVLIARTPPTPEPTERVAASNHAQGVPEAPLSE
ncbi:MAG TPA: nucleotide exchange factor GrpE [Thermoplasmata archaeon]|nr:nucleotide exchange factor GrpE [Thermoplasmata archaeon]